MVTLYWYPKCSTCQKAKKWLENNQIEVEYIDLVSQTPSAETIKNWLATSEVPIRRFFNTSGQKYREQGLKDLVASYTLDEASQKLSSDGMLIKRPILVKDGQFLTNGFKESDYAEVLSK
ncbi:arsenate reductase family protein [Enterococcus lemanii]|uniref:Arsenate reductase family protein n=1 Tax=Enterococcus lemanii TaxID=1159752 RepID=A0ABV9MUT6_9ENTE|nr:arsenate reductase family protein [Enterococcus lemanii]MBM7709445.1 arsenate reductase [Enterococcus lemanii]NLM67215.1 arsenate reductase family protein [Enterococcus sp.]